MATVFGGLTIYTESISVSEKPHKTKQTLGKRATQHEVIGADSLDTALDINGWLTGVGVKATLQTARNSLNTLNDGAKHAYTNSQDSTYDGDFVIETGSLSWDTHINPTFIRFSMRLVQW